MIVLSPVLAIVRFIFIEKNKTILNLLRALVIALVFSAVFYAIAIEILFRQGMGP
ncbi:MAG: hypothetical protein JXR19_09420 [Bacteroidia bacterium]